MEPLAPKEKLLKLKQWYIRLTFFEPYRIVPHVLKSERWKNSTYRRGANFVNWHEGGKKEPAPYVRGTLIRSQCIRQGELLLALDKRHFNPNFQCCPGQYKTELGKKQKTTWLLRHDERPNFSRKQSICKDVKTACPLCLLLGSVKYDGGERLPCDSDLQALVDWKNLDGQSDFHFTRMTELAKKRVLNRVDTGAGKARDYFSIWEVDHEICATYTGKILFDSHVQNSHDLKILIAASLAGIQSVAGSLCRVDILDDLEKNSIEGHQELLKDFCPIRGEIQAITEPGIPHSALAPEKDSAYDLKEQFEQHARNITAMLQGINKLSSLRILADVVRDWRRQPKILSQLPEKNRGNKETLWTKKTRQNICLKEYLENAWKESEGRDVCWPDFCRQLGLALFNEAKNQKLVSLPVGRLLGDIRIEGKPSINAPLLKKETFAEIPMYRWIIQGVLKAETPFFFGKESEDEQSSFSIVLDSRGHYRLPRSVIRGAARSTLSEIMSGTGCAAETGKETPCECSVCRIMRRCMFFDAKSKYNEFPEIA